ncbi:MAG TPA: EamA family transporter, partial [Ilumatobacteraceae bacterium]|nr:EamA family transporter [Ilumatobacteraceae bacterium]
MVLWSTGFVVARYATDDTGPLTFLAVRMVLAASILAAVAAMRAAQRVDRRLVPWVMLAGIGMHVLYLGGVFVAIDQGLPSGISALIAGLHPVLTALAS